MWFRSTLFFAIYIFIAIKGDKYIRFTNTNCSVNSDYACLTKCNLKALSRERVTSNVEVFILKDVLNATIHLTGFKMASTGRYNPYLVNYRARACDIIKEKPGINFVLKQTLRVMRKYSNIVKCEQKAGLYYFRDVEITYQMVKVFLDIGRYMLKIDFYEGIKGDFITLGNYTVIFNVIETYKKNVRKKHKEVEII
ncbi:hypothetical protein ACFFRR_007004 [Megaselia abdita]